MIRATSILSILLFALPTFNAFGEGWLTVSGSVAPFGRPENMYPKHLSIKINPEEISTIKRAKMKSSDFLVLKNNKGKNILVIMCGSSESDKKMLDKLEELASKKSSASFELERSCYIIDDQMQGIVRSIIP